ncbi:MAG: Na/Pi cotransporter family protein [Oscillospiraceae bacterium]
MDIFSVFTLCGGLAFFLYGMYVMSSGLEKLAGGRLERALRKLTSNPFKSLLLGAGITVAIQSSSALTVMLVGLVNSGIMQLGQTIGIIMGSNIGTTLTAWILSLSGIESQNFFIRFLKPENFSPIVALIGIIVIMSSKRQRRRDIGGIMVGFAVLMYGMKLMSSAVSPLADMPGFTDILVAFKNPIIGVIVGAVVTGIIQSSAASVGILQALSLTGSITYGVAIPIIMGQNIGTCVTAVISSIGVNSNAKRVAAVHMSFNIIGTVVCLIVFYGANAIFRFPFTDLPAGVVGIAFCHSAFNVASTAMLLPFTKQLEKLARIVVKEKKSAESFAFLDERLLQSPAFAIAECYNMTIRMAKLAQSTLLSSIKLLDHYSTKEADLIVDNEDKLDMFEDKLGTYLVRVSSKSLTDADSRQVSKILHSIGDLERIGDHALNIQEVANELNEKEIHFSEEATVELKVVTDALTEILDIATTAFEKNDIVLAGRVEPLEEVIDGLISTIKMRHIERLQSGKCTIGQGFVLNDLLANYERVSDHCSNIAVCVIEIELNSFDTHEYLQGVKAGNSEEFTRFFEEFSKKYTLA